MNASLELGRQASRHTRIMSWRIPLMPHPARASGAAILPMTAL